MKSKVANTEWSHADAHTEIVRIPSDRKSGGIVSVPSAKKQQVVPIPLPPDIEPYLMLPTRFG
jgi:hypothetical protein